MNPPDGLRERAAQLLMVRLGSNVPPPVAAEADLDRVRALLPDCPVGGLIVFRGHAPGLRTALGELQAASEIPLLVGSDLERGMGQQVEGGTRFPHAMAIGNAPDPKDAAERLARCTAQEALAMGIHLAFAPVTDIHLTPENPIIGPRAFGDTADRVGTCVEAYIRGARQEGLLTCAKHFPGHGRTVTDSHETLPVVDASTADLEAIDLSPFRRAIEAGVDTIMTAHVAYPSLDASGTPATASRPILTDRLRHEMGFTGCVVSDSLLMDGIAGSGTPGQQAAGLVAAGVDLLLDPQDPGAVVDGLVDAVHEDMLPEARLHEAFERVWVLKQKAFSSDASRSGSNDAFTGTPSFQAEAKALAREGMTIRAGRSSSRLRSVDPDAGSIVCLRFSRGKPSGPWLLPGWNPDREWIVHAETPGDVLEDILEDILQQEATARLVVCAVAAEPAAWQSFGLPEHLEDAVAAILDAGPPVVLGGLGSPHAVDSVEARASSGKADRTRVDLYSDEPVSREAFWAYIRERVMASSRGGA